MTAVLDRNGTTYETALMIQRGHLDLWKTRLRPDLFEEIEQYVVSHNQPATETSRTHQVFRGQDLIEIIKHFPHVSAVYPPLKSPEEVI